MKSPSHRRDLNSNEDHHGCACQGKPWPIGCLVSHCFACGSRHRCWVCVASFQTNTEILGTVVGSVILSGIVGGNIVALSVAYGPMAPLFTNVQRLELSVGNPVPDVAFHIVTSDSGARFSDYKGKVLLVNLWATWCPPCLAELPTLNRLQTTYREQGLVVITLSDEAMSTVSAAVRQRSPSTVNGCVESFDWLPIRDFRPFTLIIDQQGILRDYLFADQQFTTFEKRIHPYLK
jgi:thiol-disulfide isomerase/thioredoxin